MANVRSNPQSYCHCENRDSRFVAKRSFFSNPNFIVPLPCGGGLRGWVKSSKFPSLRVEAIHSDLSLRVLAIARQSNLFFVWIATKIRLRSFFRNDGVITRPLAPSAREGGGNQMRNSSANANSHNNKKMYFYFSKFFILL